MSQYSTAQAPTTTDELHFEALQVGWLGYTPKFQEIFDVQNGNRANYDFQMINGGAGLEEVAEAANFPGTTPAEVGNKVITPKRYAKKISLTRRGMDTGHAKTIALATQIGRRSRTKLDQIGAAVFQNAFIASQGYGITVDGTLIPLCGTAQKIGNSGITQSNKITPDLTKTSLTAASTALALQKDHDGELYDIMPGKLLVGATERHNAEELLNSRASTVDNKNEGNVNVHKGLEMISWAQLENPSGFVFDPANDTQTELSDNWFMLAANMGKDMNPFKFVFTRTPTFDIRSENVTENGSREYRIEFDAYANAINYLGVVGSDGTT